MKKVTNFKGSGQVLLAVLTAGMLSACGKTAVNQQASGNIRSQAITCIGLLDAKGVAASVAQVSNPAAHAIDGDLTTRWSGKGTGSFITADLGASKRVCGLNVGWYLGDARTNNFSVSVSEDGSQFKTVFSGTSARTLARQSFTFAPELARYVRLSVNGNSQNDWASVTELQVAGAATGFVHPGILVSGGQLNVVRAKVAARAEPWTSLLSRAKTSRLGQLSWVAAPVAEMRCGAHDSPDVGCSRSRDDAAAAYTQALIWAYTGDRAYAANAIGILNAYASRLKMIRMDSSDPSLSNGVIQAAWLGEMFPRAAEILRYTDSGWSGADAQNFGAFLKQVMLPHVAGGWKWSPNNWELSMADAMVNIGIYADDRATFDRGVALWRSRTPSYIYLSTDGPLPVATDVYNTRDKLITLWHGQTTFVDGLGQETCRDFGHQSMGLASIVNVAETAQLQGLNLYGEQQRRISAGLEFQARYLNRNQTSVESWLCGGKLKLTLMPTYEIGYNHYGLRRGLALPELAKLASRVRSSGPWYTNIQMAWESLTHAGLGSAELP